MYKYKNLLLCKHIFCQKFYPLHLSFHLRKFSSMITYKLLGWSRKLSDFTHKRKGNVHHKGLDVMTEWLSDLDFIDIKHEINPWQRGQCSKMKYLAHSMEGINELLNYSRAVFPKPFCVQPPFNLKNYWWNTTPNP